jgi:hypothetical protein
MDIKIQMAFYWENVISGEVLWGMAVLFLY